MPTKFYNTEPLIKVRRQLRKDMPQGEARLWRVLRGNNLGFKFRRQYSIGPFITDFCCPAVKLVIEVDGITHENEDAVFYDKQRQKYLETRGFTVIRFSSAEMFTDLQDVAAKIVGLCKKLAPPLRLPHPARRLVGGSRPSPYKGEGRIASPSQRLPFGVRATR